MTALWTPWVATADSVCPCPGAEVEVMLARSERGDRPNIGPAGAFDWTPIYEPEGTIIAYRITKPAPRKPAEWFVNEYENYDAAHRSRDSAVSGVRADVLRVAVRCVEVVE